MEEENVKGTRGCIFCSVTFSAQNAWSILLRIICGEFINSHLCCHQFIWSYSKGAQWHVCRPIFARRGPRSIPGNTICPAPCRPTAIQVATVFEQLFLGVKDATQYGYSCYQYNTAFNLSEDCLTLNVVRPSGYTNTKLPVLVWIYGGGLYTGSTTDPQYNISGIVRNSQDANTSIIVVSMNYQLGVWGLLQTPQILVEDSSSAGLLDQRLASRRISLHSEVILTR